MCKRERPEGQEVRLRSPAVSLTKEEARPSLPGRQEPGELDEEAEAFKSGRKGGHGGCS